MSAAESLLETIVGKAPGPNLVSAPVRAFAWARVSTDMQGDRGQSMEEQLRQIREYAVDHGIEIVEEFSEVASAFQREEKRVIFRNMIDRAKREPEVNAILVHDYSRFSRDTLGAQILIRDLLAGGVRVISLIDPELDLETSTGAYMGAITFAKNDAFSREIRMATRRGCRGNVQARDPDTGWAYSNGGQPLWGYEGRVLSAGVDRRGKPIEKTIWVRDETIVTGRPMHEWVRHLLVEMAGQGASLNEIRDFCEAKGLPARRKGHWGTSTIYALLQPYILAKYTGLGIWNVHERNGRMRPRDQWLVVENAHPAILKPEEAEHIATVRREQTRPTYFPPAGRSRSSSYLLSGGLFKCGRCGANMVGFRNSAGTYYRCGSSQYRRGKGCGPGVYVPVNLVEEEVIRGLRSLVADTTDAAGFARLVNDELARLWAAQTGCDPEAEEKLAAVDARIDRIRRAIEDGLKDATWANARLPELQRERERLQVQIDLARESQQVQNANSLCPKVSVQEAMTMRRDVERLFALEGSTAEKKQLLRIYVQKMKLAPERREVELTYRVPGPIVDKVVAGAGFEPATFGL
jgi:DNA invertase Pin-like site-specific DNA recombinase